MSKRNFKKLFNFLNFAILLYCGLMLCVCGFAQGNFVYETENRIDPFVPLVSSDGTLLNVNKDSQQALEVDGIIYDKAGASFAIVDSVVVKTGDTIGGYKVLGIEENKVIFDKDGRPVEVEIYKEEAQ